MRHLLTTMLLSAAVLLSGNIAWAHGPQHEIAAKRFEKAARVMQHRLYHHYGRGHLTRAARLLARQARHYRRIVDRHQPPWRVYQEFAELRRCFKHFRHDWRSRPVAHGAGDLEHAVLNLRRRFLDLRRAQREAGDGRGHDAWVAGW